jgi:hypothetical protein
MGVGEKIELWRVARSVSKLAVAQRSNRWQADACYEGPVMKDKGRLHKLCSQALREEDPQKLAALLAEIESALSQVVVEIREILQEVDAVLRRKIPSRIH